MNPDCDTCKLPINPDSVIYETDQWRVLLANDQGYLGRCYVTAKNHTGSLGELSDQQWKEYARIVTLLETACKKALGAEMFNWTCLMNNAFRKQPSKPHVHWHFRPRYRKDVSFGDLTFEDPQFGYHYDRDQQRNIDVKVYMGIRDSIKKSMD
ncbi:MAG: HIT family protein [Candidatus Saccharibacteria bacterium]|nr:HIT family protein [Candidatus Saccharibacteria bacterium]